VSNFIAKQHQQAAAIGGFVDRRTPDFDAAEIQPGELAEHLVMIAGNIDDPRAAPGPFQYAPEDIIMAIRPEKPLLHPPAVDNIANQIEGIAIHMIEKIDQQIGVTAAGAEMDIGNPDRPISGPVPGMHPRLVLEARFIAIGVEQRNIGFGKGGKILGHKNSYGNYP
jgi:hypothetical protein